jgi:hypothetical protein
MNFRFKFLQEKIKLHRRRDMAAGSEWRKTLGWKFPYKGHSLSNPQYIKDKEKLFNKNGNGWWVNDGRGWSMDEETPMQRQRRYRENKI